MSGMSRTSLGSAESFRCTPKIWDFVGDSGHWQCRISRRWQGDPLHHHGGRGISTCMPSLPVPTPQRTEQKLHRTWSSGRHSGHMDSPLRCSCGNSTWSWRSFQIQWADWMGTRARRRSSSMCCGSSPSNQPSGAYGADHQANCQTTASSWTTWSMGGHCASLSGTQWIWAREWLQPLPMGFWQTANFDRKISWSLTGWPLLDFISSSRFSDGSKPEIEASSSNSLLEAAILWADQSRVQCQDKTTASLPPWWSCFLQTSEASSATYGCSSHASQALEMVWSWSSPSNWDSHRCPGTRAQAFPHCVDSHTW